MINILPHYEISEQTMALIPANDKDYKAIALETGRTFLIKKNPFEIIERGCMDNFCSFDGRRGSITHLTGFKRKVPIPISVYRNIFVFPTSSITDWKCCWIFYHHVESIVEEKSKSNQSVILFKNGMETTVDVQKRELLKQLKRTSLLLSIIKKKSYGLTR